MDQTLLIGIVVAVGVAITLFVLLLRRQNEETRNDQAQRMATIVEELKTTFAALSRDALSSNADDFLKLARTKLERQTAEGVQSLEAKKKLIDVRLEEMNTKLSTLNALMRDIEKQRAHAQGLLKGQIEEATQATNRLHETTAQLREALASPHRRGQWGERMAEDVLRLVGFIEGVNYLKQQPIAGGTRPDYTFLLPDHRQVHMDVKFPLDNYLKVLDATDDASRDDYTNLFLNDVRSRIKEVTTRSYIDPAGGTVDYVLVFIPNEQVYGFIHQQDSSLLDYAMRRKVVLCSPMTLYAILAVIRQGIENFHLEQSSKQVLELLAGFSHQWKKYVEGMGEMGKRLEAAMSKYQDLVGVRTRQLDRQFDKIEDLRAAREDSVDATRSAGEPLPPADAHPSPG